MKIWIFIGHCTSFCIFYILVVYVNYYDLALDCSRICLLFISDFVNEENFYVYLSADKSYQIDFVNTFEAAFNFLLVALVSIMAYCEYFIHKKFYWSYLVSIIAFVFYCIISPYDKLYFFIAYFVAFALALCEIKILYALQGYLKIRLRL